MNFLVVGGNNAADTLGVVVRAMERSGHHVTYVPTAGRWTRETNVEGNAAEVARIMGITPGFFECLLWWNPKNDVNEEAIRRLRALDPKTRTVYWTIDDPYYYDSGGRSYDGFELAVTCSRDVLPRYEALGIKAACIYPPCDSELHGHAPIRQEDAADLMFAASNCYSRERYPAILVDRRDLALSAAKIGSLTLYGQKDGRSGWLGEQGSPLLAPHYRGWHSYEALPSTYASAKICINSHVRPDGVGYLNQRVMEIMGSGGFMLCDRVAGIEDTFAPDIEIATWATLEEFESKARFYLAHETARAHIAAAGRERALRDFSGEVFVQKLYNFVKA